ncbi:hypothetical protein BV22DRAFT_1041606 [Leucogyrophana mollusca]|uniref:Uncharacterized protein n=1 Tax=Leucogyrophana mollusca TaxID=85980 RepID=A0ACB8AZ82_9AGAM|nr:hypothetical protein BV22DRAFT_1041606 [Leucogyrophana mollusca]
MGEAKAEAAQKKKNGVRAAFPSFINPIRSRLRTCRSVVHPFPSLLLLLSLPFPLICALVKQLHLKFSSSGTSASTSPPSSGSRRLVRRAIYHMFHIPLSCPIFPLILPHSVTSFCHESRFTALCHVMFPFCYDSRKLVDWSSFCSCCRSLHHSADSSLLQSRLTM